MDQLSINHHPMTNTSINFKALNMPGTQNPDQIYSQEAFLSKTATMSSMPPTYICSPHAMAIAK